MSDHPGDRKRVWGYSSDKGESIGGRFDTKVEAYRAGAPLGAKTLHTGRAFTYEDFDEVIDRRTVLSTDFFASFSDGSRQFENLPWNAHSEGLQFEDYWPEDSEADARQPKSLEKALRETVKAWVRENVPINGCVVWDKSGQVVDLRPLVEGCDISSCMELDHQTAQWSYTDEKKDIVIVCRPWAADPDERWSLGGLQLRHRLAYIVVMHFIVRPIVKEAYPDAYVQPSFGSNGQWNLHSGERDQDKGSLWGGWKIHSNELAAWIAGVVDLKARSE